jgi:hypothetical protein
MTGHLQWRAWRDSNPNLLARRVQFRNPKGWRELNPLRHLETGSIKFRKEILTNPQVIALLDAAVETDLELLPYQLDQIVYCFHFFQKTYVN